VNGGKKGANRIVQGEGSGIKISRKKIKKKNTASSYRGKMEYRSEGTRPSDYKQKKHQVHHRNRSKKKKTRTTGKMKEKARTETVRGREGVGKMPYSSLGR